MAFYHVVRYYLLVDKPIIVPVGNEYQKAATACTTVFTFVRPHLKVIYNGERWLLELDQNTGLPLDINDRPITLPKRLITNIGFNRLAERVPKELQTNAVQEAESQDGQSVNNEGNAITEVHTDAPTHSQRFLQDVEGAPAVI